MKIKPTRDFTHLWNDMSYDERKRLIPHAIESQKLHIIQCKEKAIESHKKLINEYNEWINNLDNELNKYRR